jgi:hypothetical protein
LLLILVEIVFLSLFPFLSFAHSIDVQVSEEAKKEIAELSDCGCGFDIWIASAHAYRHQYAQFRGKKYGEISWIYALSGDGGSGHPLAGMHEKYNERALRRLLFCSGFQFFS